MANMSRAHCDRLEITFVFLADDGTRLILMEWNWSTYLENPAYPAGFSTCRNWQGLAVLPPGKRTRTAKPRRSKALLAELRRQCRIANHADRRDNWRQFIKDYPDLTHEDVQACLAYAHAVIANDSLDAVRVGG